MERKLLFSVTAKDCDWSFTKGTGAGGQKKNKTSSAVHCTHRASRAHAFAQDSRSQYDNRILAFKRMVETKEFKKWHAVEVARVTGAEAAAQKYVEAEIKKIRVEVKQDGKWVNENDEHSCN